MSILVAATVTVFVVACWFACWCIVRSGDSPDDDEYRDE